MITLIFAHLKRRSINYIAVCIELIVVVLVCNILLSHLVPFIQGQQLYKSLKLSSILCCTTSEESDAIDIIAREVDARILWRNYRGQYALSDENLFVQPVEKSYLRRFALVPDEQISDGPIAVVASSLTSKYKPGNSYTVVLQEPIGEITFSVVLSTDTDLMFIPPSGDAALSVIGRHPHTVLLALDDNDLAKFDASDVYTLEAEDNDAQRVTEILSWNEKIITAMSCEDAQSHSNSLDMNQMGMPIVISLTAVSLCLAGMLSNTLLSIIANERNNAIYYICGYTWKKCALVQFISDLLIVFFSILMAYAVMQILSKMSGNITFQKTSFILSVAIVAVIFTFAEILGIVQITKRNVAEIAERMK